MKRIPFNEIPVHLLNHDGLNIFGGKIYIKKHLTEIIGGVPVYNFEICRPEEDTRPVLVDTMNELNDYTTINNDGFIPRCLECDYLPVFTGYYYDEEVMVCLCSYECLVSYMNRIFGKGRWKEEYDKEENRSIFYVKKKDSEEYRKYNLYYNYLPSERINQPIFDQIEEI